MLRNPYYNKETMNLKQLAKDIEKQGFTCEYCEEYDSLIVTYYGVINYVEISLTGYKDWCVAYCDPFNDTYFYNESTNWGVIKLLKKLRSKALSL